MTFKSDYSYRLEKESTHWKISFDAMASPCEVMIRCNDKSEADRLASLAINETRRIEKKFSRYRSDNIVHTINNSNGKPVTTDEELKRLLDYAQECYQLSEGMFDITSGILRRAWKFDGSEYTPNNEYIRSLLEKVGWDKVNWDGSTITLLPDMEIDFGGIGKEYAVDIVSELLFKESGNAIMVNFGGDIRTITDEENPTAWVVGIENPKKVNSPIGEIKLTNGGVATSGDLFRHCVVDGIRLGHILNPRTGYPVSGAPRSVTVLGNYCVEAGFLATLAILHGSDAEKFLKQEETQYHCVW